MEGHATSSWPESGFFSVRRTYLMTPSEDVRIRPLLSIGLITRILIDTGTQMFFPFLPIIAEGLGISTVALGRLVSLRSLTGFFALTASPISSRRGYRYVLRLGLIVAGIGYLLIGLSNGLWLAVIGMVLGGIGSYTFVPTLQAYLSAYLPYKRRARGLGFVELGWALSGVIGLFLVGEIIARTSWRVPFVGLGVGLIVVGLVYSLLPAAHGSVSPETVTQRPPLRQQLLDYVYLGEQRRSAWAAITTNSLVIFAALHTFISYGTWLLDDFGLGAAALGRVGLVLGLADLTGASIVTLTSDRIGKRRGFLISAGVGVLAFLVLPWLGALTLLPALAGLVLARFAFEASIVGLIPLLSEQAPNQRGKVLALGTTSALLGGALAGITGPWAYAQFGLPGLAIPSAILLLVAWLMVAMLVRDVGLAE